MVANALTATAWKDVRLVTAALAAGTYTVYAPFVEDGGGRKAFVVSGTAAPTARTVDGVDKAPIAAAIIETEVDGANPNTIRSHHIYITITASERIYARSVPAKNGIPMDNICIGKGRMQRAHVRLVADEVARRGIRWLVETVKALASMAVGAAMLAAVSCTGIADVLQPFSADNPQEKPDEISELGTQVARLKVLSDELECPVEYWVRGKEIDLLRAAMAQEGIDHASELVKFAKLLNNEKSRADEADARAEEAEAVVDQFRSLIQPAAEAAEGNQ